MGGLHEPHESEPMFRPGRLYSTLDIVGACRATCDQCGRWQRTAGIDRPRVQEKLGMDGWTFPFGRDLCPVCSKKE